MPTVEERVAYLEGRLEDHAGTVGSVRQDVADLRQVVRQDVADLRQLVQHLDQKVDRLFYNLDSKVSRQFIWIVGIQVALLLAIVGAILRRF